jgi:hypothetical protein
MLFFIVLLARSDDGRGAEAFCERARSDFNRLLQLCESNRTGYWNQRSREAIEKYNAKSKELQATSEILRHEPNAKELEGVFAFDYLNQINEVQLDESTTLVEDLGQELLNDRVTIQLMPKVKDIEAQFAALQGNTQAESVQNSYADFLQLERSITRLKVDAPVKEAFVFEPKANAYSSEPIKSVVYNIHDWKAAFLRVDEFEKKLQPIQDKLHTARFFSPKDPIPWLPAVTQLTFLMVAIAGWIKSYHSEKAFRTIGLLVVTSMLLSVVLVFYSKETLFNILVQSVIPGGFILYWIGKNNHWFHRTVATHDSTHS